MKEIRTLSVIEKVLLLSDWPLFRHLATDELALIAAGTTEASYEAGEEVGPEHPAGGSVHFLVSGSVELVSEGRAIRRAGNGEAVGSLAIVEEIAPDERIRILEATHALLLSGEDFERAVSDHPVFAMAVIRSLLAYIRAHASSPTITEEDA